MGCGIHKSRFILYPVTLDSQIPHSSTIPEALLMFDIWCEVLYVAEN